jgi:hypothetical protein
VDETQLQRTTGDNSCPSGKKVQAHNIFKERTLAAGLGAKDCDSGQRDLLVEAVIAYLVDDVDELSYVFKEVSLQELLLARHFTY